MIKRTAWMIALLGLGLALLLTPAASAQGNAKVRVVHASPDAPAVDVYVNGNKVLTNVPFFTASDYLDLPAGAYDIKVTPTGDPNTAVIDAKGVTVDGGKAYTIAATGKVAELKPTIFVDDLAAPASGKAKVRVYHLSPDAPAVDVAVKGGPVLVSNLAFPNASDYLEVAAGSYDLEVRPTGTTTVALPLNGVAVESGKIYSAFANGLLTGTPALKVDLAVTTPAASAPTTLPTTSGEASPLVLFGAVAAIIMLLGLAMRRQAR